MRDIVSEIIRRVKEEKTLLDAAIASGTGIHSFEQYRSMVGKGEGLQKALTIIDDILTENDEAE
jgi:hypothetical protein